MEGPTKDNFVSSHWELKKAARIEMLSGNRCQTNSSIDDQGISSYDRERIAHWNGVAGGSDLWSSWGSYYHRRLTQIYRFLVVPGLRVLEIGCGCGELLASLKPGYGVGIDFSEEMVRRATQQYPDLTFVHVDAHQLNLNETFDIIILSDIINDLRDVQQVFEKVRNHTHSDTRILLNFYSHLWAQPLITAQRFGLATPTLIQNWLTVEDVVNLLHLTDFEVIRHWEEILWPLGTPIVAPLANRYLVKLWPFRMLALTNFLMARPQAHLDPLPSEKSVSVIVPARNEEGNVEAIFSRIPKMGSGTELIFVEGHSKDDTYRTIEKTMVRYPHIPCKLMRQTGDGKGDAVRLGFSLANGDILMVLDADLTVPPEDLPRFYRALNSGKAEFVNGVRLVYPMDKEAMRFLNLVGNKFFSLAFSWLLGQPIKDTLCGTKVLTRENYQKIARNRSYFGDFDPFGDFDLIFGAVRLNLKIVDMPIRYRERTYGDTNIHRWRHGWLLLKMMLFAAKRLKFV
jgi:2-polyprenyl-3-methyl-5-hydroxy-6-metoxy-1,4-benzoquinol methylase